jgi:type II secretory pathway pseudopilin PulG
VKIQGSSAGFSLVETIMATSLLATSLVALAQLLAIGTQTNATARDSTLATILAQQKMEQLRGLAWGFDLAGVPFADVWTDTAAASESPVGGRGLQPSPPDTLWHNTDGYVDYLDSDGVALGGGSSVPRGAMYVRRWSIERLPADPDDTLVFQILVRRRSSEERDSPGSRAAGEVRLVGVKTRKTR